MESPPSSIGQKLLNWIEWLGNKLPDAALLFVWALAIVWLASFLLAPVEFADKDPRTGEPLRVASQLTGPALIAFLTRMVRNFVEFPPLGQVLVVLLGVGVAEHTGLVNALVKAMLRHTPSRWLTPMLMLVGILSHSAGDPGYALVIPLGGVIFAAAGRHPLVGIGAAFAAVSGGFSASFLPASIDPLLQGFTQKAAQIIDPLKQVNPLCNWGFMSASSVLLILVGWYITDRVVEPRLAGTPIDGDAASLPTLDNGPLGESRGLAFALAVLLAGVAMVAMLAWPAHSVLRSPEGSLVTPAAPLMQLIVPLIFLLFLGPGIAYGWAAGTVKSHRDVVQGMTKAMGTVSYYMVMVFFAAQFTAAFSQSKLGLLVAVKGAHALTALQLPGQATVLGIIVLTATINLLIGSASAKWALLSPIFVPMLMTVGLSPELTQAAFRVGDSSTNIITPLMPFFPLVVVYMQRYQKNAGVGTLVSLMLPYSMAFLAVWTALLLIFWWANLPLGLHAGYTYSR